jgi:hypothetical protein
MIIILASAPVEWRFDAGAKSCPTTIRRPKHLRDHAPGCGSYRMPMTITDTHGTVKCETKANNQTIENFKRDQKCETLFPTMLNHIMIHIMF